MRFVCRQNVNIEVGNHGQGTRTTEAPRSFDIVEQASAHVGKTK